MPIATVGLSSFDFAARLEDLPGALTEFEAWGVESVELPLGELDVVVGGRILPDRLALLTSTLAGRPFSWTVHGPLASTFSDPVSLSAQLALAKAALTVCGEIGATAYVHHGGWVSTASSGAEIADRRALEIEALREIGPIAEAARCAFCVENIFGDAQRRFSTPSELAAQISVVDHPFVRATIDFSHAALDAAIRGFDLMAELAVLAPVAGHLHVHDSFGRPDAFATYVRGERIMFGFGDLHLPPSWGALDWDAIGGLDYASDRPIVANLELSRRFQTSIPASIDLVRSQLIRR